MPPRFHHSPGSASMPSIQTIPSIILAACLLAACDEPATDTIQSTDRPAPPAEPTTAAANEKLSFNTHVQPVLSEYCYQCHGPDAGTRAPSHNPLRLDRAEDAFRPREDGNPVIIPGDPEHSLAVRLMRSRDPEEIMPPPESHKEMPREAIDLLVRWIAEGAEYEDHWAFTPPQRPQPPDPAHPEWVNNPIDAFIQDELEQHDLAPMPPGDPRALARRAALDITGLLPDPEQVERFAADPSDAAYAAFIESLFNTPAYAEHRARYWLDYVRYADTHGLHFDNFRSIWPYRDYIIRSFAANKPFDQFVREQLAGDLIPASNADPLIATGYIRSNVSTSEGGTIVEEVHAEKTRDRTEAFGATFLGLTVGCAACHDHKFDPVSIDEFFSLAAFFHNTAEVAGDQNRKDPAPVLRLPVEAAKRAELDAAVSERSHRHAELRQLQATAEDRFNAWLVAGHGPQPVSAESLELHLPLDEARGDLIRNHAPDAAGPVEWKVDTNPPVWGESVWFHPSMRMDIRSDIFIPDHGDFEADESFSIAMWIRPRTSITGRPIGNGTLIARGGSGRDHQRGWELALDGDKLIAQLIHRWPEQVIRVETAGLDRRDWTHVGFTYDGSGNADGLNLFINGKPAKQEIIHDTLAPGLSIRNDQPLSLGQRADGNRISELALQELMMFRRALDPGEFARLPFEHHVAGILESAPDPARWNAWQRHFVFDRFFMENHDAPSRSLRETIRALDGKIADLGADGIPTLIAQSRPEPPHAWRLGRGEFANREALLDAGTPAILPPLPDHPVRSRLDLAESLFRADHPLFARVTVNRMWQELFGTAIVTTPDDFGIMGDRPSHPHLLDWLAVEFRESGWDVRHVYRLMLTSHTYRQSQRVTKQALAKDPANRLLSRGPRFRMDAEMLRDTALQASGLLVDRVGGPPVKPYQPGGIWEAVSMPESDTKHYQADEGANLYRRSLYTFWKRFAPPPSLETFDAQAREVVCVGRARTNTPLQALVSMNDPQFFEAARLLADRAIRRSPEASARLDLMARLVLARPFDAHEKQLLLDQLAGFSRHYHASPAQARELLGTGAHPPNPDVDPSEAAAWTLIANLILNLDEALVK